MFCVSWWPWIDLKKKKVIDESLGQMIYDDSLGVKDKKLTKNKNFSQNIYCVKRKYGSHWKVDFIKLS